jgi:hypothetical protein
VPDVQRLMGVLVFNSPTAPREAVPLSRRRWVNRAAQVLLVLEAGLFFVVLTRGGLTRYAQANPAATDPQPALYGVWQVEEFTTPSGSSAPLFTAKLTSEMHIGPGDDRWMEVIIGSASAAAIRLRNGVLDSVGLKVDASKNALSIRDSDDESWKCDFIYRQTGDRELALDGRVNGSAVAIKLYRVDSAKSILVTRGFRWINEYPF